MDYEELEEKMRPGRLSQGGFLGGDESIEEVLKEDDETVKVLGLIHKNIADRLEYFIKEHKKIRRSLSDKELKKHINKEKHSINLDIDEKYLVSIIAYGGYQDCPWGDKAWRTTGAAEYSDIDVIVRNREIDEEIFYPGLAVHLIRKHHFYEGKGSPYRVDPEEAARILEIRPKANARQD